MYKVENGEIIKSTTTAIGGLESVIQELEAVSLKKSALEANLERATQAAAEIPALEAQLGVLVTEAKKIPVPDDLTEECIVKLQQYNIL